MEIRLLSTVEGGATDLEVSWRCADNEEPGKDKITLSLYDEKNPGVAVPFICVNLKELHAAIKALWGERFAERMVGDK
jgi:hypothetical protein